MKENTIPAKAETKAPDTREESRTLTPPVDIFETADGLAVIADLPGVEKGDVNVAVDKGILTIRAASKGRLPDAPLFQEFELHDYFRQFQLSDSVDQEKIRAEMKYGVLTIYLPKVAEKQPKKITVNVASQ